MTARKPKYMMSVCISKPTIKARLALKYCWVVVLGVFPVLGKVINKFLPRQHLLSYLDAILRVYNLHGRRDKGSKYRSRIKILVYSMVTAAFAKLVNAEWEAHTKDGSLTLTDENFATATAF